MDAYEREHFKVPAPDPIEAIRFRMEQEGLTTKDLLPIFKTRARASEVLAKKRRLNLPMIRRLHAPLSIPIECLVQDYKLKHAMRCGSGPHQERSRAAASRPRRVKASTVRPSHPWAKLRRMKCRYRSRAENNGPGATLIPSASARR